MNQERTHPRVRSLASLAVALVTLVTLTSSFAVAAKTETHAASAVLTLGSGAQTFYVVDYNETVSIYVNGVAADYMLEQLRSVGGPSYRTRVGLTRPVTMSLHRVSWRSMFDRMFSGLNVVYHFRGSRVDRIRVLSLVPGRNYKVAPHPLETEKVWMQVEADTAGRLRAEDHNGGLH